MDLKDIPIIRHLPLAAGILKVAVILSGYLLFPGLVLYYIDRYQGHAYSIEAKWYFGLRAFMWAVVTWIFVTFMQCMWTNMIGGPDPMEGDWFFFSWPYTKLFSDTTATDVWFYNEAAMCAILIGVSWLAAFCLGKENSSGDFITHESYDEGLRKLRESGDTYDDLLRKERERKSK